MICRHTIYISAGEYVCNIYRSIWSCNEWPRLLLQRYREEGRLMTVKKVSTYPCIHDEYTCIYLKLIFSMHYDIRYTIRYAYDCGFFCILYYTIVDEAGNAVVERGVSMHDDVQCKEGVRTCVYIVLITTCYVFIITYT